MTLSTHTVAGSFLKERAVEGVSVLTPTSPKSVLAPPYMKGADWVVIDNVPETFLLSSYPLDGYDEYWNGVVHDGVVLGVQLSSISPEDYHLSLNQRREYRFGEVHLLEIVDKGFVIERDYRITRSDGFSWAFTHLQFKTWGDMKTPSDDEFDAFMKLYQDKIRLLQQFKALPERSTAVVQVHCMGGVGRTGTFVYTRALRCQERDVSPYDILNSLREQRSGLVETSEQEVFARAHAYQEPDPSFLKE